MTLHAIRVLLSSAAVVMAGLPAFANPAPAPSPANEEIREAIANLDHPQFRVRMAAAKKLANLAAIEPLAQVAATGSIEAADRAMKILEDLAANASEETKRRSRETLHQLAASKTQARQPAREILKRHRGQTLDIMLKAGARFQFDDDRVRAIYVDNVEDLSLVLPLLRELPELTEVSASNKKFGDPEMKHLEPLKNLRWLNLFESNIGDESLKLFAGFPDLESVPMGHTRVTDEGLKNLGELKKLDYLGLRGNAVTDAGMVHLKKLPNLSGLTLEDTKITGSGFEHLRGHTKLITLRLQNAAITDEGLAKLSAVKSLRQIDIRGTKVTGLAVENLRDALPDANIISREGE